MFPWGGVQTIHVKEHPHGWQDPGSPAEKHCNPIVVAEARQNAEHAMQTTTRKVFSQKEIYFEKKVKQKAPSKSF